MTENPRESLDDIQQVDAGPEMPIPPVPVRVDGPVITHELPARQAPVSDFPLTAVWQMVTGADLKRKRITLIGDAAWMVSHDRHGGGRWPANVPLPLNHGDAVWARLAGDGTVPCTLTVIPENWAD